MTIDEPSHYLLEVRSRGSWEITIEKPTPPDFKDKEQLSSARSPDVDDPLSDILAPSIDVTQGNDNSTQYLSSTVDVKIRELAKKEYPSDYSMQAYVIKKETKAFSEFQDFRAPGVPDWIVEEIKTRATKKWHNQYSMRLYETKKQVDSYLELEGMRPSIPPSVLDEIKAKAKEKWPTDYSMQVYEIEKQVDAYKKMN